MASAEVLLDTLNGGYASSFNTSKEKQTTVVNNY
jgi:hypothetical protein